MNRVRVNTNTHQYNIYLSDSFELLKQSIDENHLKSQKVCIITDTNVNKYYGDDLLEYLSEYYDVYKFVFKAGENSKNIDTIQQIYDFLIDNHFDRQSMLIALGGGVVGDMTGFVASTYMRGLDYIQMPTSLLAQVDSSVGGKTGFDYKSHKNIIGAFYQPKLVYINISTLNTLETEEFNAGMAEVIKHGLILDENYYRYLKDKANEIKALDYEKLQYVVKRSCEIKAYVVSDDEKEHGVREILNFGHTIGHAIESLNNFKLVHGNCVAIGIVAAAYISYKTNSITKEQLEDIKNTLLLYDLPISNNNNDITVEKVYKQLFLDKKVKNGVLKFILIKGIGNYHRVNNLTEELIKEAIEYIL